MTKPEDIPQDVWDKAVEITMGTMAFGSPLFTGRLARAILSAVEEDREAVRRFARAAMIRDGKDDWAKGYRCAAADIDDAIRNRKES